MRRDTGPQFGGWVETYNDGMARPYKIPFGEQTLSS